MSEEQRNDGDTGTEDGSLQEALDAAQAKADEHWELYLRSAAESENARKRAARDVEQARRFALERFVTDLVPVRDSLEMGLAAVAGEQDAGAVKTGVEMTLKQLDQVLEAHGVEIVDPLGARFDPERHEAMSVAQEAGADPGTVIAVVQKGVVLNGRLIRPARVIVAGGPSTDTDETGAEG